MTVSDDQPQKELTPREAKFVERYAVHLNGARAAREAGYSEHSCYEIAWENLRKPQIKAALVPLLEARQMSVEEGLSRLADWARGSVNPFVKEDGTLDLTSETARAHMHLIKKITQGPRGIAIELHDAKDAVVKILEAQGKINPAGQIPPVTVNIIRPAKSDDGL